MNAANDGKAPPVRPGAAVPNCDDAPPTRDANDGRTR